MILGIVVYKNLLHKPSLRGITILNTPAMPLNDAHFGGFFASGGCR